MGESSIPAAGQSRTDRWWSVPQALAWIVTRDESRVERASSLRSIASLQRASGLPPVSTGDGPPISLAAAPAELLRAARRRRVTVMGRLGQDEATPVPIRQDTRLWDHGGRPCLGDETMRRAGGLWSELWIRADECKACWPPPNGRREALAVPSLRSASLSPKPTSAAMEAWYRLRMEGHDPQQPPPSREDDLKAAERHFGIGGLKDLVRTARRRLAPASWKQPGAKGRKRRAHAASRSAAK